MISFFMSKSNYMFKYNNYLISIFILFTTSLFAQKSEIETKILSSVDNHEQSSIELLKKIVNINSGTMNFDGVKMVGNVLMEEFKALGMNAYMTSGESFNRAGHLIATNDSNKGPHILLIGHLDTVFEPSSPFQNYTMINDSTMNGPGVADMKGGDVIILLTLKALKDAGILDQVSVKVVMTGDEEKSGSPLNLSKKELIDASAWADIALGFENADGLPETVVINRRGSTSWELKVEGKAGHSSQVFTDDIGNGAIYEVSRILTEFYNRLSNEENLTFNPGVILGGTDVQIEDGVNGGKAFGKTNVVAQKVIVKGDLRAVSLKQLHHAKKIMDEVVNDNYPGTSATLTFDKDGGYPPFSSTSGNELLMNIYSSVSQDLGYGPVTAVNPRDAGAADISFTSGLVNMAIDGLGLSGSNDHSINETGNLNMLSVQAKRAAILIYRLSNKQGK